MHCTPLMPSMDWYEYAAQGRSDKEHVAAHF